jgi:hypothetical protein
MPRPLSVTLIAVWIALAGPSVVLAAGVCREANCGERAASKDRCDRAALDEATSEFVRERDAYVQAKNEASGEWTEAMKIYTEADDDFREAFNLPEASTTGVELTLHLILEKAVHHAGGEALAEEFAAVASTSSIALMLYKGIKIDSQMMGHLSALNAHGDAALNTMDEAYAHLQQARKAHDRMDKLAASCETKSAASRKPAQQNGAKDQWKPSGQREADAARQILSSWKKVYGGYEDAKHQFHDADEAFQEALATVQSGGQSQLGTGFVRVADTGSPSLSDKKRAKVIKQIARGFTKAALAARAYVRIGTELKKIGAAQERMKLSGAGRPRA